MAQTITHQTEGTEYATRAEIAALWNGLQQVVDGLQIEMRSMAEALGLPARPARSPRPARTGARPDLHVVTDASVAAILKAARS